jgi:hypothetical protein
MRPAANAMKPATSSASNANSNMKK